MLGKLYRRNGLAVGLITVAEHHAHPPAHPRFPRATSLFSTQTGEGAFYRFVPTRRWSSPALLIALYFSRGLRTRRVPLLARHGQQSDRHDGFPRLHGRDEGRIRPTISKGGRRRLQLSGRAVLAESGAGSTTSSSTASSSISPPRPSPRSTTIFLDGAPYRCSASRSCSVRWGVSCLWSVRAGCST